MPYLNTQCTHIWIVWIVTESNGNALTQYIHSFIMFVFNIGDICFCKFVIYQYRYYNPNNQDKIGVYLFFCIPKYLELFIVRNFPNFLIAVFNY